MNVREIPQRDRTLLLTTFKRFRSRYREEEDEDYSHRDTLENKLQTGQGQLSNVDRHLLRISVEQQISVGKEALRLRNLLGEDE